MCEGGKRMGEKERGGGESSSGLQLHTRNMNQNSGSLKILHKAGKLLLLGRYCHVDEQYSLKKPLMIGKETSDLTLSARVCNPATRHPQESSSSAGEKATVL